MKIDCSNILINISDITDRKLLMEISYMLSDESLTGVYYRKDGIGTITLSAKSEMEDFEQKVASVLSHESLHHVIDEYVGWKESDLIDIFMNYLLFKLEIDHSGILLK